MSKPILKWAGGKSQLINQLERFLPKQFNSKIIKKYAEPFFGGGALFFYLQDKYKIEEAYISDTNKDLILLYRLVKENLDELLKHLNTENVDGVICGHSHQPIIKKINDKDYLNTGDWIDNCSYILETNDGEFKLNKWQ